MRKNIVSNDVELLCDLCTQLWQKRFIKKVVLSKPLQQGEIKSVIIPKIIKGTTVLQIETYTNDNKVFHQNIINDFRAEFRDLFYRHSQINVYSSVGECQYMMSKKGKETLIGAQRILQNISKGRGEEVKAERNNKTKNYILLGEEDFLRKLGISDESGRVRDRMQSKFRQINKFLEYVDLCCGKSYLSFAVYHYFRNYKKKNIKMVCIDLKSDVIEYCSNLTERMGFNSMEFVCMDINEYEMVNKPDLVVSLHACDIATDIVLNKASDNGATVILSTPCCHHELNHKINCAPLSFVTDHSMLRQKLCDAATDALRLLKLESEGYDVSAMELIDPEDTPKNIILKAIKKKNPSEEKLLVLKEKYKEARRFLLGEGK